MSEVDGESEYDNGHIEATDGGGTFHGPPSIVSFDMMSFVAGASTYLAPRDIPFSQCVPHLPVHKTQPRPQQRTASPDVGDCPTDPEAQVEWHNN